MHAHYLAPAYKEALQESEMWLIGGIPVPDWTPELALEFMDNHGIAVQMLSVSDPGVGVRGRRRAPRHSRATCNDYVAGVVANTRAGSARSPSCPMTDVEEARARGRSRTR